MLSSEDRRYLSRALGAELAYLRSPASQRSKAVELEVRAKVNFESADRAIDPSFKSAAIARAQSLQKQASLLWCYSFPQSLGAKIKEL